MMEKTQGDDTADLREIHDWFVKGPEGGDGGGTVIATGTPEEVAQNSNSYTGKYIKKMLKRNKA